MLKQCIAAAAALVLSGLAHAQFHPVGSAGVSSVDDDGASARTSR